MNTNYKADLNNILNETALLMDNDEILNEGVISTVTKALFMTPVIAITGIIGFSIIYSAICSMTNKKDMKKLVKSKKLINVQEYQNTIIKNYNKIISQVKFCKYNPNVINMMNDFISFAKIHDNELEDIDNEFRKIKNLDEFNKKKSILENKYKEYNKKIDKDYKALMDKYKNIKTEWKTDDKVIPVLTKYINFFLDYSNGYYKSTDEDDLFDNFDFTNDLNDDNSNNEKMKSILYEVVHLWKLSPSGGKYFLCDNGSKIKTSSFGQMPKINTLPFNYIKFQFSGDKISE